MIQLASPAVFKLFKRKRNWKTVYTLLLLQPIATQYLYCKALKIVDTALFFKFVKATENIDSKQLYRNIVTWYPSQKLGYNHTAKDGQPPIEDYVAIAKTILK